MKIKTLIQFKIVLATLILSNTLQGQFNFVQPSSITGTATPFAGNSTPMDLVGDPAITPSINPATTTVASYSSSFSFNEVYLWIGTPNTITMNFSSPISITGVAIWNTYASSSYTNTGFEPNHSVNLATFEFFNGPTSLGSQNINVLFPYNAFGTLYPLGTTYINVTRVVMTIISNHGGNETGMQEIAFNALPINLSVELSELSLACKNDEINVTWITTTERNNDFFTLERSKDGITFEKIATIPGNGTSTSKNTYSWIDHHPFLEESYYRLSQRDYDGISNTYPIKRVKCLDEKLNIYPNPFENQLTISSIEKIELEISDLTGKIVLKSSFEPGSHTISTDTMPVGTYLVNVTSENCKTEKIRLMKSH